MILTKRYCHRQPIQEACYRPDGARCAGRTMWRYSKGPWLGKCGHHSRNKDQHRCDGEDYTTCSGGFRKDLGILKGRTLDWHPNKTCGGHKYWQPPEKHTTTLSGGMLGIPFVFGIAITVYHAKLGCNPVPPFRAMHGLVYLRTSD